MVVASYLAIKLKYFEFNDLRIGVTNDVTFGESLFLVDQSIASGGATLARKQPQDHGWIGSGTEAFR